jgi:hypothetical protein
MWRRAQLWPSTAFATQPTPSPAFRPPAAAFAPALAQQSTYATGLACDWFGDENSSHGCFTGFKTSSQLMAAVDTDVDK